MSAPEIAAPADLRDTLHEEFGFDRLRHGQEEVIRSVLAGQDTLAVMPTGAGKSLCYQLPGLELEGTTVIVSPLISLMKDQVDKLLARGHAARRLDSTLTAADEREALEELAAGRVEFLFVTPERLAKEEFLDLLAGTAIDFVVIDEAHCVSRWGHDFRPDYLEIGRALDRLGRPPFLALTATAGPEVVDDLREHLRSPGLDVVETGIYRPNLRLEVELVDGDEEKRPKVAEAVAALSASRGSGGSGIVYTATVRHAEELAEHLGVPVYHGRLARGRREEVQDGFMAGEIPVVVATNAFGMGIDKPDIRLVLHYDLPASPDAYYQEAGRAGRDGEPARCLLLYDPADAGTQKALMASGRGRDARSEEDVREDGERDRERLARMERYAQTALCRWANLVAYFDAGRDEPRGWWCGHCDSCERQAEGEELPARRRPAEPEIEELTAEPICTHGSGETCREEVELTVGAPVAVPLYGEGRVTEIDDGSVTVSFRDGAVHRVRRPPDSENEKVKDGGGMEPPAEVSPGGDGVMKIESLQSLFVEELEDAYDFEHQIVDALPKMAEAARDPELQKGFRQHLEQTKDQIERLEEVFREVGEEPSRKTCKGMKGLLAEGDEVVKAKGDDAAKDAALIGAAQRVEHYEMAAYGTLSAFARTLGHGKAAKILDRILDQESKTDERLSKLAESRVNPRAAGNGAASGKGRKAASGSSNGSGELSKEELYERAQELGIEGRSKMSKQELQRAVERHG